MNGRGKHLLYALHTVKGTKHGRFNQRIKQSKEQYDDRVVEVAWSFEEKNWKILRFRDDKKDGNHRSVVNSVIESIVDGVEKHMVR